MLQDNCFRIQLKIPGFKMHIENGHRDKISAQFIPPNDKVREAIPLVWSRKVLCPLSKKEGHIALHMSVSMSASPKLVQPITEKHITL